MELELNLSDFYCLNKNCPDYGMKLWRQNRVGFLGQ